MANVDIPSMWERHAARRTFPLLARTKVCRNLFGPVDHEELNCEMKRKLQEISDRDQSRWNFNFDKNLPLLGHYEWEEITSSSLPAFYQESVRNGKSWTLATPNQKETEHTAECECKTDSESSAESQRAEVNQENRSGTLNARKPGLMTPLCRRRKRAAVSETLGNNTTHITEEKGVLTLSRLNAYPKPFPPFFLRLLLAKEFDDCLHWSKMQAPVVLSAERMKDIEDKLNPAFDLCL